MLCPVSVVLNLLKGWVFLRNLQAWLSTKPCQLAGPWTMRENMCDLQHVILAHTIVWLEGIWTRVLLVLLALWHLFLLASSRIMSSCPASLFSSACSGLELWVNHPNWRWKETHEVISSCPCQQRIIPHSTVLSAFSNLFLNDSKERAFLSSLGRLALQFSRPHCWGICFLFSSLNSPFP